MGENTTLIVTATPNPDEMASVQSYLQGVLPLLLAAGGSLVKRQKVTSVINGKPSGMVLVMDFDDAESVSSLFASDGYKALVPARDKGFSDMNIMLATSM